MPKYDVQSSIWYEIFTLFANILLKKNLAIAKLSNIKLLHYLLLLYRKTQFWQLPIIIIKKRDFSSDDKNLKKIFGTNWGIEEECEEAIDS